MFVCCKESDKMILLEDVPGCVDQTQIFALTFLVRPRPRPGDNTKDNRIPLFPLLTEAD